MLKAVFIKTCLVFCLCLAPLYVAAATNKIQPAIMDDVQQIAYGAGLVKFCPLLSPTDYISFTQDQIMAERIINFEHAGDYKHIFKNQEVNAKNKTNAGQNCAGDVLDEIIKAELLMKKFTSISPLKDEIVISHPQQPKLNQAFIFAGFLHARLAWIYQRKCKFLQGDALDEFNHLMLQTQVEIESVFRPEQAQKLNARINERHYAAIIYNCAPLTPHIDHAIEMMSDDLPNAMEILKRF